MFLGLRKFRLDWPERMFRTCHAVQRIALLTIPSIT
uniref:Uncharacterized protein n=1 Tax=Rhizophora mucronata TaxID=61149 RepID=A0A2P2QNL7_RHIMU